MTDSPAPLSNPCAYQVVVVAASAGGLLALRIVLGNLPGDFPIPILVVQHLDPHRQSMLASILSRYTSLTVKQAEDRDRFQKNCVYIAPPDRHMLVEDGQIALSISEQVHFLRPSADILFRSAAESCVGGVIAVVLSGTGSDGSDGVKAVKNSGGVVIVQDPISAEYNGMPKSAIATGAVDFILPLDEIARTLISLARRG